MTVYTTGCSTESPPQPQMCVWSRPANPQPIQPQPIHTDMYSVTPGTPQPESTHLELLRHFVGSQALKPL